MKFKNTANGYVEEVSAPGLWVFLFGFFYFAIKGVWTHVVASFLLAICALGISWLVYPFLAKGIMRKHYLAKGWAELP